MKRNKISQEQKKLYYKNGYLIIKKVIDEKTCDSFYQNIKKFSNNSYSAIMNPDRIDFLISQSFENLNKFNSLREKIFYLEQARKVAKMCRELLKNKKTVQILEELQNKKVCGLMSQMLFKEAGSEYSTQAWQPHQDNAYPKNKNGQYLTVNFFLKKADKQNGSIYAYKSSHLNGIYDHKPKQSYREKVGTNPGNIITGEILSSFEKIDLSFDKGDILVLHGDCIHGSYPNYSNLSRPLFSCSYITEGEHFIPGKNAQRKIINLH